MEFLDSLGLKYLINKMKTWVITKLGYFWGNMKFSRVDWEKTQWGFKVDVIDDADSEIGKSPKLWINSSDWIYSKWSEITSTSTSLDTWFPIVTAPAQYANLKSGNKNQTYYTNNIQIQPILGNLKLKEISAQKFIKKNGTASSVLMADGSLKDLNLLPGSTIKSLVGIDDVQIPTTPTAYQISQSDYELFCGQGSKNDLMFFQIYTYGTLFQRMNREFNSINTGTLTVPTPRFYGDGVILWAVQLNNLYYVIIANSEDTPPGGYKGWPDNVVNTNSNAYLS